MVDKILGVSLSDYQMAGPGEMGSQDFAELQKALQAGEISGLQTLDSTAASGAPLKVESLENTLKLLTFKESDIVLWKEIPKMAAFNTVEEYNQLTAYGNVLHGAFNNEGELPETEDSTYIRRAQLVKFMGVTREVTHPLQLVNTMVGNIVQREITNGTMYILRQADRAIWSGNASLVPQEWNGILKQHMDAFSTLADWQASEVAIDAQNKILNENHIQSAQLGIIQNFGEGGMMMAPPRVYTNFVQNYSESKFIQPNTPAVLNGFMGQKVDKFMTQFGQMELKFDKFMASLPPKYTNAATTWSGKAPGAPTADGVTPKAVATDTSTKFGTAWAGDYWYAVSAFNRYGESPLTVLGTGKLSVAATEAVDLKFTAGAGATPTGYRIYRTKANPSTLIANTLFYPIFEVSTAQLTAGYDGGAAGLIRDLNRFLPDTDKLFILQSDLEVYSFKQLAPLMKMDLAVIAPSTRFMVLLYGTPVIYAPKKMAVIYNIGSDASK